MMDYMLENTNPEYVFIEMDVYWVVIGDNSPVDYFKKYPGRFKVLHIKDQREIGQSGMVGFDAIFNHAEIAGVKHIVVELEKPTATIEEGLKTSIDYLLKAPFVKASYNK
jgi:sugar phosphate isomerase/epimerase